MNLALPITPLNTSAIPASWITLSAAQPALAGNVSCQTFNRFDMGDADRYGFTRVLPAINPAAPSAESVKRESVFGALNRVKDRFGAHQAKHIIKFVGLKERMVDIQPDRFLYVLRACQWLDGYAAPEPGKYHWTHRFDSNGAYIGFSDL